MSHNKKTAGGYTFSSMYKRLPISELILGLFLDIFLFSTVDSGGLKREELETQAGVSLTSIYHKKPANTSGFCLR